MKATKIASLFILGAILCNTALATDPRPTCYEETTDGYRIFFDHDTPKTDADAESFFDNDPQCTGKLEEIRDKILAKMQNLQKAHIYAIFSTDNTGDREYNERLAARRGIAVSHIFADDRFQNTNQYYYFAGESDHNVSNVWSVTESDADFRIAEIIIAGPEKHEELIQQGATEITLNVTYNVYHSDTTQISARQDILAILSNIRNIEHGFKTSVWKTADGNFNGARLASDSIAGVVLGTAGGLITSNVIKKNQIKSGFENVMCTVGGQYVSGYDDEFMVSIR